MSLGAFELMTTQGDLIDLTDFRRQLTEKIARTFLLPRALLLPRRPRFKKARLVHARRARKLRRRGESVYFERWENGHCVYSWGGPTPTVFKFRCPPLSVREICSYTSIIDYRPAYVALEFA